MDEKPVKQASALRYAPGDNAPVVVAAGKGETAEKIIAAAQENGIAVHVDPECARLLSFVELDAEIPYELYEVVARILAFVSMVDSRAAKK